MQAARPCAVCLPQLRWTLQSFFLSSFTPEYCWNKIPLFFCMRHDLKCLFPPSYFDFVLSLTATITTMGFSLHVVSFPPVASISLSLSPPPVDYLTRVWGARCNWRFGLQTNGYAWNSSLGALREILRCMGKLHIDSPANSCSCSRLRPSRAAAAHHCSLVLGHIATEPLLLLLMESPFLLERVEAHLHHSS